MAPVTDHPDDDAPAHRWGFGAFLLVEAVLLLSAVFLAAILDPHPKGGQITVADEMVGTIVPTALAAAVAVLVTVLRGNGPVLDLRLTFRWADIKVGLKFGAAGIVLTIVAAVVWTRIVGANDASSAINTVLDGGRLPVTAAIVMFLYVWLIGPVCEEIIFRGLLWGAIQRQDWGRWAAFGLSTAIFAASHLEPIRTTLLLVIAVPIGLARLFTGRLPASIIAHQMNNFLPALAMLLVAFGVMAN
ncbi:MAG TPA: CPBP family intramembrane glutamic endopeptidase [Pseudonocardiaceae bacterium]|nr:CPBP family intramembrane glutamic endopeptidase [Pseudonocardiaceae bacterium]